MAGDFKTNVRKDDITVLSASKVAIASPGLLNTFVQSPAHGIAKLTTSIAPVHPEDVRVDSSGRILITNVAFAKAVKTKMATVTTARSDTNYVCTNAYHCAPVKPK
jgi:hypothetical protein